MILLFQKPQLAGWFPLLFLFLIAISGQTRIQLQPGAPPVTMEGDVAKAGLKFTGRLTTKAGKAGFSVEDAEGKGLPEEGFDFNTNLIGSLTKTGEYKISVATFDAGKVNFVLSVRVF